MTLLMGWNGCLDGCKTHGLPLNVPVRPFGRILTQTSPKKIEKKNALTYFTSAMWVTITVFTEEMNQNDDATFAGVCTNQVFPPSSSGEHDLQAEASLWHHIAQFMMACCDTFTTFYNAAPAILELCDTMNNNAVPTPSRVTQVTSLTHIQRLQQPRVGVLPVANSIRHPPPSL